MGGVQISVKVKSNINITDIDHESRIGDSYFARNLNDDGTGIITNLKIQTGARNSNFSGLKGETLDINLSNGKKAKGLHLQNLTARGDFKLR